MDAACICVDVGIHAAITAGASPDRDRRIAEFRAAHAGPGHLEERPPRDWYGREKAFAAYLEEVRIRWRNGSWSRPSSARSSATR